MLTAPVLPKVEVEVNAQQYGRYIISPLESGYGVTLGNSLRRVLLSSLEGAAITAMRITDIPHEFTAIPGVREDVIQVMLRLKQVRLSLEGEGPQYMTLRIEGAGVVTAGDLIAPPEIEILNPDLYLFTVDNDETHLDFEFTVENGRGYAPAEGRGRMPIGMLPVDAIFSPVRRVNFRVVPARVGQLTNYDRLIIDIWTDGRITPFEALKESARMLVTHLRLIAGAEIEEEVESAADLQKGTIPAQAYAIPIEDLGLGVRVYNALKRTGISNVGEVLEMLARGRDAMLSIRNFGEKSFDELIAQLTLKGFWTETTEMEVV
ncbi:MAG TPA: DNA-directed RNA polymerase subunit alpha [Anaerolineae bacterium]|nr:DNA-directed RNA polymerase subunit alpha [Anaerolineae bacterium]HQH37552.1 DNA-directed RNA polymerase subunit alpha [Anaerolineae bacterium]